MLLPTIKCSVTQLCAVKLYFAGAVFASSNAALMLAQLGDEEAAVKEMQRIARCVSALHCLACCAVLRRLPGV